MADVATSMEKTLFVYCLSRCFVVHSVLNDVTIDETRVKFYIISIEI